MKARSRPLTEVYDGPLDLNDVAAGDGVLFVRDGVGLAGRGVVARVAPADAPDLLGSITHDGPSELPGVGPVALGSVPFRPGDPATLIVPATIVSKTVDGAVWLTEIEPDEHEVPPQDRIDADWTPPTASSIEAGSYRIEPIVPVEQYLSAVAAIRDAVRAGELVKAVIARDIAISTDFPIDVHAVLRRLKASFGSSYRFSVDGFIGASPELLVAVDEDVVRSHPLAGTAPRTGDVDHDADIAARLIESTKDQIEHRVVIDVVHDTLLPWCSYLDWEPEPSIVTVANVQHLGTAIEGRLSRPAAERSRAGDGTLAHARARWPSSGRRPRPHREGRGRRARPVRRCGRLGRCGRQRDVGGSDPLRRAVSRPTTGASRRRRRNRGRQRSGGRARRDTGEVPGDALRNRPRLKTATSNLAR